MILRLAPENVAILWPQVAELIQPAVDLVSTHTISDVHHAILSMRAQLWVEVHADKHVVAAVITEFVSYPVGLFVRAWVAGAHPKEPMDTDAMFEKIDHFRAINNAIGFEAIGRHGWLRKFPGAKVEGLVMRMLS